MKYIVLLGDGMADEPLDELKGATPLEVAETPNIDLLAKKSQIGMVDTIPNGMAPGSDTANLSVIGYDPKKYYTGRSPLEALSIGVPLKDTDVAMRCNIVTLSENSGEYEDQVILDHSSDEISTEDATVLLKYVAERLENDVYKFYPGTSYRHLLIWDKGSVLPLTPPHDILGKRIGDFLPADGALRDMQRKSYELLKEHPLNKQRKERGLRPANSFWFWGAGTKPALSDFQEKYQKKCAMISAVDLLKGIAVGIGMTNIQVKGANGGLNTNYEGKAEAAVDAVLNRDFDMAYIHLEAPDEMGHQGSIEKKITAISNMDKRMVSIIKNKMEESGEPFRLLILPDHPTPVHLRTHVARPVPFMLYDSTVDFKGIGSYNEKAGEKSGIFYKSGCELMEHFLER